MKNTERQQAEMKKQTIGVEIEMNNITRADAAKIAAEYFGTGRYEDTAYRNGYSSWSAWATDGREWKFQKDVSIHGDDLHKCDYPARLFILRVTSQTANNQGFWK